MRINGLRLREFRNYPNLEIEFSNEYNLLYGENAQGKTNIVEAIFLCASGRSHRTSRDMEMIKAGAEGFLVSVEIERKTGITQLEIKYRKKEKKNVKINEIPIRKIGEMIGTLNAVIFSPEDLLIIKEGPSERRRFIDITLSQIRPSYFYDLQQYAKILEQRNSLLKEMQRHPTMQKTLDIWDENLANTGIRIMRVREDFIKRLAGFAKEVHQTLSNGKENMEIKYTPSIKVENEYNPEYLKKAFLETMKSNRQKEMVRCTTLSGPQRDDYDIDINGFPVKNFGSQGQQRTAILSLKLAEIEIMREETGENPILLLDDVMSELDETRQFFLLNSLKKIQTFITCTDRKIFEGKLGGTAGYYRIENGRAFREK